MEWDNLAVLPVSTHAAWLGTQVEKNTRKRVKRLQELGVRVELRGLDRPFAEDLAGIFNETPLRRGRPYPYYGKGIDGILAEWSPDVHRCDFLAAYYQDTMIGFIKLLYTKAYARASGTVTRLSHRDKSPMNALISRAVQVCEEKGIPALIYGKYVYGRKGEDGLTEFKQHNGFQRVDVPRYYLPLSLRGRIGLLLGVHHGLKALVPRGAARSLSSAMSLVYGLLLGRGGRASSRKREHT